MIEFVTLFLGLIVGSHPVEVATPPQVARLELLLDGERVASLTAAPWRREVDFGHELAPHELTAVAFDDAGREVGRARQWVNLPRPRAEARLVVDPEGRTARLVAGGLPRHPLQQVSFSFDGEPLEVPDPAVFNLPRYNPGKLHILSAELEFAGNLRSRLDVPLGGEYASAVTTVLTAVPLTASHSPKNVSPEELDGLLRKGGVALPVVSTETGRSEIVVVMEAGARLYLGELGLKLDRSVAEATRDNPEGTPALPGGREERLRPGERVRFVATTADRQTGDHVTFDLFSISQPFTGADGDLPLLLTHVAPGDEGGESRTADAVAAAGVQAAAGNRPRALLLVLGPAGEGDASRFARPEVRGFLQRLRVPLRVWSVPRVPTGFDADRLAPTVETPWGTAVQVTTLGRLRAAVGELRQALDAQLIAWVEGSHLPQEIELAAGARGVELAH